MKYKPIPWKYESISRDAILDRLSNLIKKDEIKEAPKRPSKKSTNPSIESS